MFEPLVNRSNSLRLWEWGLSGWGDGGFGGAVGVGDRQCAVAGHVQGDGGVVGGSVVVVFAEQTAVTGAVFAAFGAVMQMMQIAVDGLFVAAGPTAALVTRRDRAEQRVGHRGRQQLVATDGAVLIEHQA